MIPRLSGTFLTPLMLPGVSNKDQQGVNAKSSKSLLQGYQYFVFFDTFDFVPYNITSGYVISKFSELQIVTNWVPHDIKIKIM